MKIFLPTVLALLLAGNVCAQSRKELKDQVDDLSSKLNTTEATLSETERKLNTAERKLTNAETQLTQLESTNRELLSNMNKFLSASTQQSNSMNKTLEALQQKEGQLKELRDSFSANDSIALLVLTDLKKTLGEDAQIGVESGAITIKMDNTSLFGAKAESTKIETASKDFIGRVATVARRYEQLQLSITSSGSTWNINAERASVIAELLETDFSIVSNRISAITQSGSANATYIRLHPKFDAFYLKVREDLKKSM